MVKRLNLAFDDSEHSFMSSKKEIESEKIGKSLSWEKFILLKVRGNNEDR